MTEGGISVTAGILLVDISGTFSEPPGVTATADEDVGLSVPGVSISRELVVSTCITDVEDCIIECCLDSTGIVDTAMTAEDSTLANDEVGVCSEDIN